MSPSKTSSDDFPRLSGASNFDVWKARVSAALDGKHLLGFVLKKDYDGVSDDEEESDNEDPIERSDETMPQAPAGDELGDSDEVEFDDSADEELRPSADATSTTSDALSVSDLPPIRPFTHRESVLERKRAAKKMRSLSSRELRRLEAKTKAFLMKTMDDTHIRLVKSLSTSYEIFQTICTKYEGAAFHGDPYFIQHFLMEIKYEEGSDVMSFFLELENAMKAASEATESVLTDGQKSLYLFHSMPSSWKDDLRVWKGMRKYIPYDELKMSIEAKVREMQAQERYTLAKGTPESVVTKNEKALIAPSEDTALEAEAKPAPGTCEYCHKPRHTLRECHGLQQDLVYGTVKAGTVLPANFVLRGAPPPRSHPYMRPQFDSGRGRGYRGRGNSRGRGMRQQGGRGFDHRHGQQQGQQYQQSRRDESHIAVTTMSNPTISLTAHASSNADHVWTVDSGCTSHITHCSEWFTAITPSTGSITVGGKAQIPIAGTGSVNLLVTDSKGKLRNLHLDKVIYAPQLQFNLLSVSVAVKNGLRITFSSKVYTIQTDQRFCIKVKLISLFSVCFGSTKEDPCSARGPPW